MLVKKKTKKKLLGYKWLYKWEISDLCKEAKSLQDMMEYQPGCVSQETIK